MSRAVKEYTCVIRLERARWKKGSEIAPGCSLKFSSAVYVLDGTIYLVLNNIRNVEVQAPFLSVFGGTKASVS